MLHSDFEFYIETFHGSVFKDVSEFTAAEVKASAFVDNFILNPEALKIHASAERCRFAICAVAELVYNETKSATDTDLQIESETVGNHSVTYSVKSYDEIQKEKRNTALTYLRGTGPLYSALR